MPKSKLLPLKQIQFPPNCVICLSSAGSKRYPIQQIFTYGRTSHTVIVEIPMCEAHFASASYKAPAERVTEYLGIGFGILAGIFAAILLFLRWQGSGGLILKLFLGALFGFGLFILTWWVIAILIAPHLAAPESKEVRNAVRITRYMPGEQLVQLDFVNEQMAGLVDKANESS
jgi:hypothetical protein